MSSHVQTYDSSATKSFIESTSSSPFEKTLSDEDRHEFSSTISSPLSSPPSSPQQDPFASIPPPYPPASTPRYAGAPRYDPNEPFIDYYNALLLPSYASRCKVRTAYRKCRSALIALAKTAVIKDLLHTIKRALDILTHPVTRKQYNAIYPDEIKRLALIGMRKYYFQKDRKEFEREMLQEEERERETRETTEKELWEDMRRRGLRLDGRGICRTEKVCMERDAATIKARRVERPVFGKGEDADWGSEDEDEDEKVWPARRNGGKTRGGKE